MKNNPHRKFGESMLVMMMVMIAIVTSLQTSTAYAKKESLRSLHDRAVKAIRTKKFDKAAELLQRAAERGHASSQNHLGTLYLGGHGVEKDHNVAARWFKKSADGGDVTGQNNLAAVLWSMRRYRAAAVWSHKAARGGNDFSQNRLGMLYEKGHGVYQDDIRSTFWYAIAAKGGRNKIRNLARRGEKRMANKLTPEQMRKVQQLLKGWRDDRRIPELKLLKSGETDRSKRPSAGTGFLINAQGYILTNHHVINGCTIFKASNTLIKEKPRLVAEDPMSDLALLKIPATGEPGAPLRPLNKPIRLAGRVVAVGYPLPGLLAAQPNVTTGVVSALAGMRNDTRLAQISAPIQQGNSGGPLLDAYGNIAGMIVSKLNANRIQKVTGDLPQNVNFALKHRVLAMFLDAQGVKYRTGSTKEKKNNEDLAEMGRAFTLSIECKPEPEPEREK
ncbi:MAG: trypsin-like peptidase domain-containing protein [Magnetococcales bacterium]|nr:trypsin-like peptidase domain-containing protein [Magnetococcales bacterium]